MYISLGLLLLFVFCCSAQSHFDKILLQNVDFGLIQVSCERYEYPDDPCILKDSCGLEYEIDEKYPQPSLFCFTNLFLIAAIGFLLYALYQDCLEVGTTATNPLDTIRSWFDPLLNRLFKIFIAPVVDKFLKIFIAPVIDKLFKIFIAPVIEKFIDGIFVGLSRAFRQMFTALTANIDPAPRIQIRLRDGKGCFIL